MLPGFRQDGVQVLDLLHRYRLLQEVEGPVSRFHQSGNRPWQFPGQANAEVQPTLFERVVEGLEDDRRHGDSYLDVLKVLQESRGSVHPDGQSRLSDESVLAGEQEPNTHLLNTHL